MPTKRSQMDESDVVAALRKRYSGRPGEWACVGDVGTSTAGARRRMDFAAISCWPSNGLHLYGHEIKVSRSDWQKELDDPTKAGAFRDKCHFWYIAAPKGIVSLDELPATWGLIECNDKNSKIRKQATLNESATMDWPFFCSIARALSNASPNKRAIQDARDEGWREGREYAERNGKSSSERLKKSLEELQDRVADFQKRTGVEIMGWHGRNGKDAELFKAFKSLDTRDLLGSCRQLHLVLQSQAEKMNEMIKALTESTAVSASE